jgi:RNA polymerase sigma factor (sigma-70 family)
MEVNSRSDQQLLRDYAERGAEAAFAELVRRHIDLVHSAAFRLVGSSHLAEDVTQSVFLAVAQNAQSLSRRPVLSGWLHCTTRNLAANAIRGEMRRRAREQEVAIMNSLSSTEDQPAWELMAPHLDAALGQLRASDRDLMLLRFFERRSLGEIARTLGVSEEAAKKRVARALDKLRSAFHARGLAIPSVLIASALAAHSVTAAPAGLAASVAGASSAGAASSAAAGTLASTLELVAMTKLQATVLGLLFAAGLLTPILAGSGPNPQGGIQSDAGLKKGGPGALQTNPQTAAVATGGLGAQLQTNTPLARLHAFLRQTDEGHGVGDGMTRDEHETLDFLIWSLPAADYPRAFGFRGELRRQGLSLEFEMRLVRYWGEFNPPAALAAAQTVRGRQVKHLIGEVMRGWGDRDPAAALTWIRQSATEAVRGLALPWVIPRLARTDPQSAMAALAEMPSGLQKQWMLFSVVQQWAVQDPATAASCATNLSSPAQRSKLIATVAEIWAKKDPDAVLAWAQTLPQADQASAGRHPSCDRGKRSCPGGENAPGTGKGFRDPKHGAKLGQDRPGWDSPVGDRERRLTGSTDWRTARCMTQA